MSVVTPLEPLQQSLEGTLLIEASAGTGKTYTITTLVLRLVIEEGLLGGRGHLEERAGVGGDVSHFGGLDQVLALVLAPCGQLGVQVVY